MWHPSKTYDPVGFCIYCRATKYSEDDPARRLGDEHIIPRAFGGKSILPTASCHDCEKLTSGFESHLTNGLFKATRPHLGLTGRKSRRVQKKSPLMRRVKSGTWQRESLPVSEHPGSLQMMQLVPPGAMFGLPPSNETKTVALKVKFLIPDYLDRIRPYQFDATRTEAVQGPIDFGILARMLAKIAHAYAIAELGRDAFQPLLPSVIRGEDPHVFHYVGGISVPEDQTSAPHELSHQLSKSADGQEYLVVRVRLFAEHGMPSYDVVAGRPK